MKKGLSYTSTAIVDIHNTAISMGSGDLEVFATPAMTALMENAAMNAVARELEPGQTTVGSEITSSHIKPSGIGRRISATAVLTDIEGRRLTFAVAARDDEGMIGEGTHVRYVVDRERFMKKVE